MKVEFYDNEIQIMQTALDQWGFNAQVGQKAYLFLFCRRFRAESMLTTAPDTGKYVKLKLYAMTLPNKHFCQAIIGTIIFRI